LKRYRVNEDGRPETIADRLIYLRNEGKQTLSAIAGRFKVNKSTVSRWESRGFWHDVGVSSAKRMHLLRLSEIYRGDFYWLLTGRYLAPRKGSAIMIVDDDRTSSSILSMFLKSIFGTAYPEYVFSDAEKALDWARDNPAFLVLVDYSMPRIKGDRFIRDLRGLPRYDASLIIAITIHEEREILAALRQAGADHVFTKPVDETRLYQLLSGVNYG